MGIAAYNRGTAVIRRQADAQAEEQRPAIDARHAHERIRELELQILDMQQDHDRQLNRARFCLSECRKREERLIEERNNLRHNIGELATALQATRRHWRKLSAIIRATLTPQQYHDARQLHEDTYQ